MEPPQNSVGNYLSPYIRGFSLRPWHLTCLVKLWADTIQVYLDLPVPNCLPLLTLLNYEG